MSLAVASNRMPWIVTDDIHDREAAPDGFSRLGAYLALRLPAVMQGDPHVLADSARWASFVWATGAAPVMSPGYVAWNDPVEDIQVGWEDGWPLVEIVLRTACPVNLAGWRSWERDFRGNLVEPWHGDRVALSRTSLRMVLKRLALPTPPPDVDDRDDVVRRAKLAVHSVAAGIERALGPVLVRLQEAGVEA